MVDDTSRTSCSFQRRRALFFFLIEIERAEEMYMQAKIYVLFQTTKQQSNSGNVGLDAIETTEDERAHMFWMLMLMLRSTLMLPLMLISMSEQL